MINGVVSWVHFLYAFIYAECGRHVSVMLLLLLSWLTCSSLSVFISCDSIECRRDRFHGELSLLKIPIILEKLVVHILIWKLVTFQLLLRFAMWSYRKNLKDFTELFVWCWLFHWYVGMFKLRTQFSTKMLKLFSTLHENRNLLSSAWSLSANPEWASLFKKFEEWMLLSFSFFIYSERVWKLLCAFSIAFSHSPTAENEN